MASAERQIAVCNFVPTTPVRPLLQIQNPYGIVFVRPSVAIFVNVARCFGRQGGGCPECKFRVIAPDLRYVTKINLIGAGIRSVQSGACAPAFRLVGGCCASNTSVQVGN